MSEQTANLCTADACESLRARLDKHEDAEGNPKAQPSGAVCANDWFLTLPPERQAVLREDKWLLADAAFKAGQCLNSSPVTAGDTVYQFQCREIGEGGFDACDHDRYVYCQKSPEHDTRVVQVGVSAGVADERAAFEAWRLEKFCGGVERLKKCSNAPDVYYYTAEQEAWKVWQARAALSAPSHGEQVRNAVELLSKLRAMINCTAENDVDKCGVWISTKHPVIKAIDSILAAGEPNPGENVRKLADNALSIGLIKPFGKSILEALGNVQVGYALLVTPHDPADGKGYSMKIVEAAAIPDPCHSERVRQMVPDEMRSLAQRLREYNLNPHHINPMSEAFHVLVAEAADALSASCTPKEVISAITWADHLIHECFTFASTRAPSVHVYNKTFEAVNAAKALLAATPSAVSQEQGE